ncbi:DUF7586 domain-containing protein [Kitasatospora sp. NPDC001159]
MIIAEHELRIPEPRRPFVDADPELLARIGPWHWGTSAVEHLRAGRVMELTALGGAARTSRFQSEPDGTWAGLDGSYVGEPLRVVRRADGTVDDVDQAGFVHTRTPYDPAAGVPGGVDAQGWHAG